MSASYYVVVMRRREDGEERRITRPHEWGEADWFLWDEGNFSCDCNRRILFDRAIGCESDDAECGEGDYAVLRFLLSDGRIIEGPDADTEKG
jgi:hypothetical protein